MFSDAVSEDPLQLGHLKQSAVARLLVQGRLPSPPKQHGASACEEPPMDLSTRSLVNTGCGDMTSSQLRINEVRYAVYSIYLCYYWWRNYSMT